jgi:hypothetical protein
MTKVNLHAPPFFVDDCQRQLKKHSHKDKCWDATLFDSLKAHGFVLFLQ